METVLLALVLLEAAAIGLLGLLVAGLLRSHAEILRQLHHLGVGREDMGTAGPQPVALTHPARATGETPGSVVGQTPGSVVGQTPTGEVVSVALDRPGDRTLLLFLSSGCGTCQPLWEGLRNGEHARALPGIGVVVVARDAGEESPSLLGGLGPADVPVVLSSQAWESFGVPGSPFAVLVDGTTGRVLGSGVASRWDQLGSLVGQHLGDLAPRGPGRLDGAGRVRRADEELLAAGIGPGHPSLHPAPGSWSRQRP